MIIRDLTLRSAASFGSFHLIRLLYDEYMFYLVEHKVAKAIGASPMAVMGEVSKTTLLHHRIKCSSVKELTLETSALESLYGCQFTLSSLLIKPNIVSTTPSASTTVSPESNPLSLCHRFFKPSLVFSLCHCGCQVFFKGCFSWSCLSSPSSLISIFSCLLSLLPLKILHSD